MAVIKKSSSGKAIQFILGEDVPNGTVFQMSSALFARVMSENIRGDFVVLTRMPIPVPKGRFPKSATYGDDKLKSAVENSGGDAFSKGFLDERKEQKRESKISDYKVKW